MKKFILSEILLLSTKEKKAKKVKFNKKRTLIYGKNGTGKSCLIKSIYKTFGATPYKDHPTWKALNPISFVKFNVDGINYSILKDGKYYGVFDSNDELIDLYDSVTNGLGPFLASLFDFKIQLPNQKNELITPPPAFLFLPFYIDQDVSWQTNWSGFAQLQQIRKYREPIVSYHTGIKPNEYYNTKSEIEKYSVLIKDLEDEKKVLRNVLAKIKGQLNQLDLNINLDSFKEEIKQLLIEYEGLKKQQEEKKIKLVEYQNIKIILESQLGIAKNALKETQKDYKLATEIIVEDHVDCPTCGAQYENSFLERFEIAKDEDRCKELIVELSEDLNEINEKIEKENSYYILLNEQTVRIDTILENKKGEIKLKDVIENAGRNEMKEIFQDNTKEVLSKIHEITLKHDDLQQRLKALVNKDRKNRILSVYHGLMKQYLYKLDVNTLDIESYKKVDSKIQETGSALPRALIAYYFSIFQVIKEFSTAAYCPIIIDSPNQQAQDLGHVDKILNFINQNQPVDSQLILGIEEMYNVNFHCDVVELLDEKSLLQKDEYVTVSDELGSYQSKMWNHGKSGKLF